ncbi:unnamed protein product [Kluyveromyces dobzhanskii CBS 2104]|uniref:Dipeptidyl peptidase 3 n=1 Tax=Kluyveromyces dobzhanskii CBS 2104 TaxID=1427455 RepID=A0A0A8L3R7_9SACH|nr:unnamed protein product [Kluyveromyces dobzhanskii CBS 2104]
MSYADKGAPIQMLSAKKYFENLTSKEQHYAHFMSKASHAGSRITARQVSPNSEKILDTILNIHKGLKEYPKDEETTQYLEYASQFLSNLGEFKSFGDVKFIPRCPESTFVKLSQLASVPVDSSLLKEIYHSGDGSTLLGFPSEGHTSGYYKGEKVSPEDLKLLKKVFAAFDVMPENLSIEKLSHRLFVVHVASGKLEHAKSYPDRIEEFGIEVLFQFGEHKDEMEKIASYLTQAKKYAANKNQEMMLEHYINYFKTGDSKLHKESQKVWVKDLSPQVETNIGFIETYREPSGIIGEFESFVAIQNKERTAKFTELVNKAPAYIQMLPWDPAFEKPKFQPPDFSSIEVLTFTGSGIPAGINIPNYDDVRLNVGFKNVSLGNVLNSKTSANNWTFIQGDDVETMSKYQSDSFEVQVGIHELLGHGSGKLLCELEDGTFNFDKSSPPVGLDGKPVTTYYKKGETWGSKFGAVAGAYEECRAEAIAMYLITNRKLLDIFGFTTKEDQDMIIYTGFLQMCRAGLLALEYWDPTSKKWGQPHMQARFSIMKTLLRYADDKGFLKLAYTKDDYSDLHIELDKSLIETVGHAAIEDYLTHLHIYKATADVENGVAFFQDRSQVDEELSKFRDLVIAKKLPRKQFIQANTVLSGDKVIVNEYEESPLGMIQSFIEREL